MSQFGLIARIGIFVGTGLASGFWILAATKDSSRLTSFIGGGLSTLVLVLIVVAVMDLNGSRLLRSVSSRRPVDTLFEVDRIDGNETDVRALGLIGLGLNRRFVVAMGQDAFEVWTAEGADEPALAVPWSKLIDVTMVTVPSSTSLIGTSTDAVELRFEVDGESIGLDLVPHGAVRSSTKSRMVGALADAAAAAANAATPL